MKYLMMIYANEAAEAKMPKAEMEQMMKDYGALTTDVKAKGVWVAGHALKPTATATTVRVRDGKTLTSDGPFAETKEQLGGFYLLECKDLNEALQYAARIPSAKYGSIEVRPIQVFG